MNESDVHHEHDQDVQLAFDAAGCLCFPGTKKVSRFRGNEFRRQLATRGHSTATFATCSCKSKITVTIEQEWERFYRV